MPNVLEYSKIFQPLLDKQVVQESTTGWMELNENMVKYNGGNEVKLPKMTMNGMGDYDRGAGFVEGDVTVEWQTHTLTQDRGRTFSIDAMDVDETNFVATAGTIMGEFQRTQVVPEIDAYRYSKLATIAIVGSQSREVDITAGNIVDELLTDLNKMEDEIGTKDVVITMSPIMAGLLAKAGKDYMSTGKLAKGQLEVDVQTVNDNSIVRASSKLLNTKITIYDGTTGGQETGGFIKDTTGKAINWIISTKDAPIAISKTEKVRVFNPDTNQKADAYKIDYRKYHDVFVPDNKVSCIFANTVTTAG